MKLRKYRITDIPINLLISESINEVCDKDMAYVHAVTFKTTFGDAFLMNLEQLN